jgi:hypothetical protein
MGRRSSIVNSRRATAAVGCRHLFVVPNLLLVHPFLVPFLVHLGDDIGLRVRAAFLLDGRAFPAY